MKRFTILALLGLLTLAFAACASAEGLGPMMRIGDASKMPNDTKVVVKGKVKAASTSGAYILQDKTGEILFKIDEKKRMGIDLQVNDTAEVAGRLERIGDQPLAIEAIAVLKKGVAVNYTPVADAAKTNDDAWVAVKGKLKNKLGNNKYTIADKSGEMIVEIQNAVWSGADYNAKKNVEIRGEMDLDNYGAVKLEAEFLREL